MDKLSYSSCGIHIKVRDFDASRQFYEGVLDLTPQESFGDAETLSRGAVYCPTPSSKIEISEGHPAVPKREIFEHRIDTPKISAMLHVDSLLPLIAGKGIRPSYPVKHYPWNTLELVLRDPDGFVIVVIAPYSEAEKLEIERFVEVIDETAE